MMTKRQVPAIRKGTSGKQRRRGNLWMVLLVFVFGLGVAGWLFFVEGWTVPTASPSRSVARESFPVAYEDYVTKYASLYDVDEAFIYAVIKTESSFDPNALSHQDAKGLMQVTGETFRWLSTKMGEEGAHQHDDLFDPDVGIRYGTFFLSYLLEEFGGVQEVAAAYHAGRGTINQWLRDEAYSSDGKTLDQIPYPATAHYVNKIMRNYEGYQKVFSQ